MSAHIAHIGQTFVANVAFFNDDGDPPDLTGATVAITVSDIDGTAIVGAIGAIALSGSPSLAPQAVVTITDTELGTLNNSGPLRVRATATISARKYVSQFIVSIVDPNTDRDMKLAGFGVLRDSLVHEVFGAAVNYTNLTASQKEDVDRAIAQAEMKVVSFGRFFSLSEGYAPPEWNDWAHSEAAIALARTYKTSALSDLRRLREEIMESAFNSWTLNAIAGDRVRGSGLTIAAIRQYVALACVRRTPRVWPDPTTIDSVIRDVVNRLWNSGAWNFRVRQVTFTIASNGTVTHNLGVSDGWDSIASRCLYYEDGSGSTYDRYVRTDTLEAAIDADHMAALLSRSSASTGRPERFRLKKDGDTITWHFYPSPDQQYLVYGSVYLSGPNLPDSSTQDGAYSTTWSAEFPHEFHASIKDLTLAKVLDIHLGTHNFEDRLAESMAVHMPFLVEADDHGNINNDQSPRDVYHDADYFLGGHGCGSIGGAM